jgi:hypothetical protein
MPESWRKPGIIVFLISLVSAVWGRYLGENRSSKEKVLQDMIQSTKYDRKLTDVEWLLHAMQLTIFQCHFNGRILSSLGIHFCLWVVHSRKKKGFSVADATFMVMLFWS